MNDAGAWLVLALAALAVALAATVGPRTEDVTYLSYGAPAGHCRWLFPC